jgi:WD40 repeat protein
LKRGAFEEVSRIPLDQQTYRLAFSATERELWTLSGAGNGYSPSTGRSVLEAWDMSGYRELSQAVGAAAIKTARFPSPGDLIAAAPVTTSRQAAAEFKVDGNKIYNSRTGLDVTPQEIRDLKDVFELEISPDGNFLSIVLQNGEEDVTEDGPFSVVVWDLAHAVKISTLNCRAWIRIHRFSPASGFLAIGDKSGFVQILDLRRRTVNSVQRSAKITAVEFSTGDEYVAIGDAQGFVSVLRAASFEDLVHLQHDGEVSRLSFSTDRRYLAVTDIEDDRFIDNEYQEVLRIWQLRTAELLGEACNRLNRFWPGTNSSPCSR